MSARSENAAVNLKFAIRNAIASTADVTGLVAGQASETLVDKIFEEITAPEFRWVWFHLKDGKIKKADIGDLPSH